MKKYQIIYADPPWLYDNPMDDNPAWGGKTYPQMPIEHIQLLPVEIIAEKNSFLFLWVTMPKLKEGLSVIECWGFRYITCAFVWIKLNKSGKGVYSGLGHWTNGNAELCLLGKKGNPKRNLKNVKQVVISPLRKHSQKPDEVRDRIVQLCGNLPRIELFARNRLQGWDAWGLDVQSDIEL